MEQEQPSRPGVEGEEFKVEFNENWHAQTNSNASPAYQTLYDILVAQSRKYLADEFNNRLLWSSPSKPKIDLNIDPFD